jgi:hypothetical protein
MWEVWWLNGSAPDCCPAILGLNRASPQATAVCQSPGGLPPGMALGCELTSVRGNTGEKYENQPLVCQKHLKEKNISLLQSFCELEKCHSNKKRESNFIYLYVYVYF